MLFQLVRSLFGYLNLGLPPDLGGVSIETSSGLQLHESGVAFKTDETITVKAGKHKVTLTVRIHQ